MFKFDAESAAAIIEEESALATLRSFDISEVLAAIENKEEISTEEEAFNALMAAMYQLRPVGYL